jgi:hypothetical protein
MSISWLFGFFYWVVASFVQDTRHASEGERINICYTAPNSNPEGFRQIRELRPVSSPKIDFSEVSRASGSSIPKAGTSAIVVAKMHPAGLRLACRDLRVLRRSFQPAL